MHPLYAAYYQHAKRAGAADITRYSWDPITVYYAILGPSGLFGYRDNCTVTICDEGRCHINEGGRHRYLTQAAPTEKIIDALNELFV